MKSGRISASVVVVVVSHCACRRQHEWFKLNIPRYLQVSSSEEIQKNQIIDEDALEAVVKVGFTS